MSKKSLAERMKLYESAETGRRTLPLLPVLARLDGRGFSKFTKGLQRPFDPRLSQLMIDTTRFLVEQSDARVGYTQSDEITLLWHADSTKQAIFFDGRIQKIVSTLASLATLRFNRALTSTLGPEYAERLPVFDCRVWTVPNRSEAVNAFVHREHDATKNSISMAARAHFSHQKVMGLSGSKMQELLHSQGVNWNDYPSFFKRGTYIQRRTAKRTFSSEEIEALPPKHAARRTPNHEYSRTETLALELPPLAKVSNRVEVLFDGAQPLQSAPDAEI